MSTYYYSTEDRAEDQAMDDNEWGSISNLTSTNSIDATLELTKIIRTMCPILVCTLLFGIAGFIVNLLNALVIDAACRGNMSFYFKMLLSLASSDMVLDVSLILNSAVGVLIFCNKSDAFDNILHVSIGGVGQCLYAILESVALFGMTTTLLNLTIIAFDHYLLIVKPMKHGVWLNKDSTASKVLPRAVWGVSLLAACAPWLISASTGARFENNCTNHLNMIGALTNGVIAVLLTLISTSVMIVCYTYINIHMRRARGRTVRRSGIQKGNRKLLITSFLLLGTFLLCWVPYISIVALSLVAVLIGDRTASLVRIVMDTQPYFYLAFAVNTVCDPLIYAIRIEKVRAGYKQIWLKFKCSCHLKKPAIHRRGLGNESTV